MPARSSIHVDKPLTSILLGHFESEDAFAAMRAFPGVSVPHASDLYTVFDKAELLRDSMSLRARGGISKTAEFGVSSGSYRCLTYAENRLVLDADRKDSTPPLQLERAAIKALSQAAAIRHERDMVAAVMTASVWGSNTEALSGGDRFDAATTSDPIGKIEAIRRALVVGSYKPNVIVTGREVASALLEHPDVISRLPTTQRRIATFDDLAALFRVDRFIVSEASYTTSEKGASTATYATIAPKSLLLAYVDPSASTMDGVTAVKRFEWDLYGSPELGSTSGIRRWRDEARRADVIELEAAWDYVVTGADLGYLLTTVVS